MTQAAVLLTYTEIRAYILNKEREIRKIVDFKTRCQGVYLQFAFCLYRLIIIHGNNVIKLQKNQW